MRNHIPSLVRELADQLDLDADAPMSAAVHGQTRFEQGISLGDVVDDLAILRRTTIEVLGARDGDAVAVHAFFDRAMRAAASEVLAQTEAAMHAETVFRDRLLGILSHDLRNPLGAICVGTELVMADPTLSPRARKAAERVASSAARMLRMIRDLLDLTRSKSGGLPLRRESVSANEVIADAVEEMRTAHPGRTIELRGPSEPVVGAWDRDRISQILSNLISNAFEHGREDTPVGVEWNGGDELRLSVVNEGEPVPPSARARIFEPFQQGEKKARRGLGLGLFIVREIARAHGGSVELERSDEAATKFTVKLPIAPPSS